MKKTIIATTIAALFASSALPAIAANSALDLKAGAGIAVDSEILTAQADAGANAGVDASLDASEDGVNVDAGTDAGANVGVDTDDASADAGVNANANANANASADAADDSYGSVMASIKANADLDLSAITEDTDITIVTISSLQGNAETEAAALDNELTANADAQAGLHARVSDNAAIMAELEAEGYAAEDVVSLKTKADGSVIVYVDDRG
ncbi:hypothetical protein [Devosia salina]|uniref:PepSY domain-containing protein n=1 Tax=Devosia salina TaxID=2860336 RepID=A0ABX8WAZ6_9HYPH|nr:hypothetical protein [Devosia salina]QYO75881.1 hypothetical protein K1X15_14765 [Devosia salina]